MTSLQPRHVCPSLKGLLVQWREALSRGGSSQQLGQSAYFSKFTKLRIRVSGYAGHKGGSFRAIVVYINCSI